MRDWSNDLVLRALQVLEEPVGGLVRAFPGRDRLATEADWLDAWFLETAKKFAAGKAPDPKKIVASAAKAGELSLLAKPPVKSRVRIASIQLGFFRGFRDNPTPILLEADLVVVEGRNSSGKTSLSEGIEWVLTGELSRRTGGEYGNARELADCIANEFRPKGEHTWVELRLSIDDRPLLLKRVLRRDYSATASDEAESELFVDNKAVTKDEEIALRERIFAGVHPILMQHNLHRFVHDDPRSRRRYFERLLQIDELTSLIEKAVVGPARLKQIRNPAGGTGLAALDALCAELPDLPSIRELRKIERLTPDKVPERLSKSLIAAGKELFPSVLSDANTLGQCRDALAEAQRQQREARLPLLSGLEQSRHDPAPSTVALRPQIKAFQEAGKRLEIARTAAAAVSEAQRHLARVTQSLVDASLIDPQSREAQMCPVCEHSPPTLASERVKALTSLGPLTKTVDAAATDFQGKRDSVAREIAHVTATAKSVIPALPSKEHIVSQLSGASQRVQGLAHSALASAAQVESVGQQLLQDAKNLGSLVAKAVYNLDDAEMAMNALHVSVEALLPVLASHREEVSHLEEAVGAASRDDTGYRVREKWLEVSNLITAVGEDVAWERAKGGAKDSLDGLREGLISLRGEIIEQARETFSRQISEVWQLLRNDSGARFSQLTIPDARGKGYKLEFELKATITDGSTDAEVDVLRVFSESQVNVIGLAAYVTRAKLLGHKLLIFDDPVQSMDEEHFRSFAAKLLPSLLEEGFQIVILTHSDTFARRIHDHNYQRISYVSLETRATKKLGCQVLDGNRRVSERLKNAERCADDSDLQGAWRLVRLAVERLYILAYARANFEFDPETWRNLTAEDMWNRGVAELVEKAAPGGGKRMKEILVFTVAGAHDVAATSESDLVDAIKFLKSLLVPMRLGAG